MYRFRGNLVDRHPEQTITPMKRKFAYTFVYGYDTEFMPQNGLATIMTFSSRYNTKAVVVDPESKPLDTLINWIKELPNHSCVFAHNLAVDLWAILNYEGTPEFLKTSWYADDTVNIGLVDFKVDIRINYRKPVFADFSFRERAKDSGRTRKRIKFLDSSSFFMGSLDSLSKVFFGEGKEEIEIEDYYKDWRYETEGRDKFIEYAKKDTDLVRRIGEVIVNEHEKRNVPMSVSTPSLAGFAVRSKLTSELPPLPEKVFSFALNSYFGGRVQTFYKGTVNRHLQKFDLNSAYASAISRVPDFREGEWIETKDLKPFGYYYADVTVYESCLPVFGKRNATLYPIGRFCGYWCGIELLTAYECGFIKINKLTGYHFTGNTPIFEYFVTEQYRLKSSYPKSNPLYGFNKLLCNALYGKFQNLNPDRLDDDNKQVLTPGALFNPAYSSFITADCRAKILNAQKQLGSDLVNIQTDGLWTTGNLETSAELGCFSNECECDKLIAIRGNAYIPFIGNEIDLKHTKLHAYQGARMQILDVLQKGEYEIEMWMKPHTAMLNGYHPNTVVKCIRSFDWKRVDLKTKFHYINSDIDLFLSTCEQGEPYTLLPNFQLQ